MSFFGTGWPCQSHKPSLDPRAVTIVFACRAFWILLGRERQTGPLAFPHYHRMKALIRCLRTDGQPDPDPGVLHRAGFDLDPGLLLIRVFLLDQGDLSLFRLPLCHCPVSLDQNFLAGCLSVFAQLLIVYARLESVHGQMLLAFVRRPRLLLLAPGR